jgi:hypothetical protein
MKVKDLKNNYYLQNDQLKPFLLDDSNNFRFFSKKNKELVVELKRSSIFAPRK